jgi:hypothetical protein
MTKHIAPIIGTVTTMIVLAAPAIASATSTWS